jgi:hypothetical protein
MTPDPFFSATPDTFKVEISKIKGLFSLVTLFGDKW